MDEKKSPAIIIDLDDTLCAVDSVLGLTRKWEMFIPQAKLNSWCNNIVKVYSKMGYTIIFLTARLEIYRQPTTDWLFKCGIYPYQYKLFMYPGDRYKTSTRLADYKVATIQKHIQPNYSIQFAIDDNIDNVNAINKIGIKCLQC